MSHHSEEYTDKTTQYGQCVNDDTEQVATEHVPATYEKDGEPWGRFKEGMKKMVGKKTRGIGPKHSRAKPSGITGKTHAEETAKDMANLVDAQYVGVNVPAPQIVHTKEGAMRRVEHTSKPLDSHMDFTEHHTVPPVTEFSGQHTDRTHTEGESLQDKLLARKPIHNDLELVNAKAELKHIDGPSAGLTEGLKAAFIQDRSERGKGVPGKGFPMEGRENVDETFSGLRHVQLHEGLSESIKAAYLEDQRERAEMGNEKFERQRQDRSHEGEVKGMGQKILEGIQSVAHTATQGFHTATEMIMGSKSETHEGTHKQHAESGAHDFRKKETRAEETAH
jgi:hypothetical protein